MSYSFEFSNSTFALLLLASSMLLAGATHTRARLLRSSLLRFAQLR